MIRLLLPAVLTCLGALSLSAREPDEPRPESPALKKSVRTPEDIVPAGWEILEEAKGDLNGDKADDTVLVLTHSNREPDNPQTQRILIVLLAKDGGYEVSAVSDTAVLSRFSGGVMGDPFESVTIEHGTFLISHYGGSAARWGMKYRYALRDGKWYLIEKTDYSLYRGVLKEKYHNLVTGEVVQTVGDEEGNKESEKKTNLEPNHAIPLEKVDMY